MCTKKTAVPWGFLEEFAYSHLLDVVVVCLLLLFPSFDVVVCLPIVPCSAKYFLIFMISLSCCFRCSLGVCILLVVVGGSASESLRPTGV